MCRFPLLKCSFLAVRPQINVNKPLEGLHRNICQHEHKLKGKTSRATCPGEGGHGAEAQGSVETPGQRGGGSLALVTTVVAVDELGEVRGWSGDESVRHICGAQRRDCGASCKVSATQEQRNGLLPEIKVVTQQQKHTNT